MHYNSNAVAVSITLVHYCYNNNANAVNTQQYGVMKGYTYSDRR